VGRIRWEGKGREGSALWRGGGSRRVVSGEGEDERERNKREGHRGRG